MAAEITVGIPTHNRREMVLMALASALEQTRPPARVIVLADGCSDGTQEAVRELGDERIELLDLPKAFGVGYLHRNEVLKRAGDGVVAWLADDDLWLPDHLERVGELFDAGIALLVQAMACKVYSDGTLEPFGVHWSAPTSRDLFLEVENRTPSSAVSHLATTALDAGGWPADFAVGGDWDLWQRMVCAGARPEMVGAPTVLFFQAEKREQAWDERLAQNAAFLERIRDPAQLAKLRAELAFACSVSAQRAALLQRDSELSHLRAERDELIERLETITSGGWWRLRRRLAPAMRLVRRLRGPA